MRKIHFSKETIAKRKGENHYNWSKVPSYTAAHNWMRENYGRPKRCEKCRTTDKDKWFEWASLDGKTYPRNRKGWLRLCRSCHRKHDGQLVPPHKQFTKAVEQWTRDGATLIKSWPSLTAAATALGIKYPSCISNMLRGKHHTAGGYVWKWPSRGHEGR